MKHVSRLKTLFFSFFVICLISCGDNSLDKPCGRYNGYNLYIDPKGKCYYIDYNENKIYVPGINCFC